MSSKVVLSGEQEAWPAENYNRINTITCLVVDFQELDIFDAFHQVGVAHNWNYFATSNLAVRKNTVEKIMKIMQNSNDEEKKPVQLNLIKHYDFIMTDIKLNLGNVLEGVLKTKSTANVNPEEMVELFAHLKASLFLHNKVVDNFPVFFENATALLKEEGLPVLSSVLILNGTGTWSEGCNLTFQHKKFLKSIVVFNDNRSMSEILKLLCGTPLDKSIITKLTRVAEEKGLPLSIIAYLLRSQGITYLNIWLKSIPNLNENQPLKAGVANVCPIHLHQVPLVFSAYENGGDRLMILHSLASCATIVNP